MLWNNTELFFICRQFTAVYILYYYEQAISRDQFVVFSIFKNNRYEILE